MLYYEVVRKYDASGKLLPEMILVWYVAREVAPVVRIDGGSPLRVHHQHLPPSSSIHSNALRNNLIAPNEYIRGCTLRLLAKLREPELLESLIPSVKACLAHRHPYVRRNALLAVYSIFRSFPDLFPDAPDEVEKCLEDETDAGARRNAFLFMFNCAQDRALAFLTRKSEAVTSFGDGFSLVLLELIVSSVAIVV